MFTSRKISSKGHNECDNGSNSGINSVSVSTKFSLTSFYGAKYAVTEILSESDSDSNNYNDDNNTDSFALCGGQTNDIEFDIGDSVVIDFNDSTRSKTVLDQSTHSNKKLQGKSDLISRKCKKKNYNNYSSESDKENQNSSSRKVRARKRKNVSFVEFDKDYSISTSDEESDLDNYLLATSTPKRVATIKKSKSRLKPGSKTIQSKVVLPSASTTTPSRCFQNGVKSSSSESVSKAKMLKVVMLTGTTTTASSGSQTESGSPNPITNPNSVDNNNFQAGDILPTTVAINSSQNDGGKSSSSSLDEDETPKYTKNSRLNISHPEIWERNIRKKARNLGQSYQTKVRATKEIKVVTARKIGPPCKCKKQCFTILTEDGINKIFNDFWAMGDYNMQTSYLIGRVIQKEKNRKRTKAEVSKRNFTLVCTVEYNKKVYTVCKEAFDSLHGICRSRVACALKKKTESGSIIKDLRGSAPNPRKYSEEVIECVHNHIRNLPVMSSHYTRRKNQNRQYLEAGLNIKKKL